jgi:hypothetical protein
MDFLSIDIETTGLDHTRHQMIEFGCVWDRVGHERVSFRALVLHKDYTFDPYCVTLHTQLFEEINALEEVDTLSCDGAATKSVCTPDTLPTNFRCWLEDNGWDGGKLNITGKNYSSFDADWVGPMLLVAGVPVRRRVLDPAILFVEPGDDKLPNLDECLSRAGVPVIDADRHTAVYDALCVCLLLRAKGI